MNPDKLGALVGGLVCSGLISSLIGAVILRAAMHWIERKDVSFGDAFGTMFIAIVINSAAGATVGAAAGAMMSSMGVDRNFFNSMLMLLQLMMLPVSFLVQSMTISVRHQLTFGRAALVTGAMYLIMIAVGLVVAAVVVGLMFVLK